MTIAQRLIVLIASTTLCLLLLSGLSYLQMDKVYRAANYGNEDTVPSMLTLDRAATAFYRLQHWMLTHAVSHDAKKKVDIDKRIEQETARVEQELKNYAELVSDDEDRRLLAENQRLFTEFKDVVAAVVALSWDYEQENAILKVAEKQPLADALSGQFAKHKLHNEALGKREAEAAAATKRQAAFVSLALLAAAVAVSLAIGIGTMRRLTARIAQANRLAAQVAGGDLRAMQDAAPRGGDEIGRLMDSLERMRADLAQTIAEVATHAGEVDDATTQLSDSAQRVAQSTEGQTAATASAPSLAQSTSKPPASSTARASAGTVAGAATLASTSTGTARSGWRKSNARENTVMRSEASCMPRAMSACRSQSSRRASSSSSRSNSSLLASAVARISSSSLICIGVSKPCPNQGASRIWRNASAHI